MSFNLLDVSTNFIDFAVEIINSKPLGWIETVVSWLINSVGIIGLGIVLFTLILKTIVLPLDTYSRVKMKKQSLIMKSMRPQMEKLQQQYANDKAMYSQKVMELQKQNGISMFGACLPMIVTLVIFMVVFSSFSFYSQYANLDTYNSMVIKYNESVQTYVLTDLEGKTVHENGFLIAKTDESIGETAYLVDFGAFKNVIKEEKGFDSDYIKNIYKELYKLNNVPEGTNIEEKFDKMSESEKIFFVRFYVKDSGRRAAAKEYRESNDGKKSSFLWVNNIWYPDSPLNKEVPEFSKFSSTISRAASGDLTSYGDSYDEVTYYLRNTDPENPDVKLEGNKVNGYFVLIVLAIGLMFLQQFITMRSQKDANELGTVDGSGAKQNKWMLIMMPLIYGVFSFFYSAAFSIYMITNTLYGLITTVIINKIMDVRFAKEEANGGYNAKRKIKNQNNRKRLK